VPGNISLLDLFPLGSILIIPPPLCAYLLDSWIASCAHSHLALLALHVSYIWWHGRAVLIEAGLQENRKLATFCCGSLMGGRANITCCRNFCTYLAALYLAFMVAWEGEGEDVA